MDPKIFVDKNTNSILNDMEIKLSEAFLSYNLRSMCETTNSEWGITLTLPIEIPLIVDSSSANCCSFSLISEGMTLDHGLTTDCWHNDKILKKKKKKRGPGTARCAPVPTSCAGLDPTKRGTACEISQAGLQFSPARPNWHLYSTLNNCLGNHLWSSNHEKYRDKGMTKSLGQSPVKFVPLLIGCAWWVWRLNFIFFYLFDNGHCALDRRFKNPRSTLLLMESPIPPLMASKSSFLSNRKTESLSPHLHPIPSNPKHWEIGVAFCDERLGMGFGWWRRVALGLRLGFGFGVRVCDGGWSLGGGEECDDEIWVGFE